MGCCQSHPRADVEVQPKCPVIERLPSLVNLQSHHKTNHPSGLKVHAHSAGWQANAAYGDYHAVHTTDDYMFAALFDAHTATEAAAFCKAHCVEVFQQCLRNGGGDVRGVLKETFKELDARFFKSQASPVMKAACGASGVAVYVEFSRHRCYVANLGTSQCVVGWATGGFNSKNCDGRLLTRDHSARDPVQQQLLREEFPSDPNIIHYYDGKPMLKGVTKLTRCIGYGLGKDSTLAGHYNRVGVRKVSPLPRRGKPYISNEADVAVHALSPQDEHILLVSEGVLQLLSPTDTSLFCSQFSHANLGMLQRSLSAQIASTSSTVQETGSSQSPAAALVRYAMVKAADNWRRKLNRTASLSIEDIRKLQLSGVQPKSTSATSILRGDVHDNIGVLAITFDWPRSRSGGALALGRGGMQKHVAYRWQLALLFCRFMIVRRRTLLKKWWKAVDVSMRKAREAARHAEVRAWVDQGEALQLAPATVGTSKIPRVPSEASDHPSRSGSRSRSPSGIPSPPNSILTSPSQKPFSPTGNVDEGHPESPPSRLTQDELPMLLMQATMRSSTPTSHSPKRVVGSRSSSRVPFTLVNAT
ncbi:unnamed protein product [Ostreobium quekettii]|uniref:PPM-type phosphatase domain-containing protein n=1 Tax=Ostreobium quekettii TaxID=121088 RepID=A0A8S1INE7_9CHLO|nr:unnamed protein product [Ostreobium quekettii]|eukprot:evm.model.scf_1.29 EVM.evm.TU.scf_1.29   scf_1:422691-430044(+)